MTSEKRDISKERPFSDEETHQLLGIMMNPECKIIFNSNKRRHVTAWNLVQKKLAEKGIHKTPEKIKNRFSNLKNKYLAIRRKLISDSGTRTPESDWMYYKKFQQLLDLEEKPKPKPQPNRIDFVDSLASKSEIGNYNDFVSNISGFSRLENDNDSLISDPDSLQPSTKYSNFMEQFESLHESRHSETETKKRKANHEHSDLMALLKEKFEYEKARQNRIDKENKERDEKLLNVLKTLTDVFLSSTSNSNNYNS